MKAIIGKKVGMSQIFDENGHVIPVTVIEAGPCTVVQKKTSEKEGYNAVQLGYEDVAEKKLTKGEMGHLNKAGVSPKKHLREFDLDNAAELNIGDIVKADTFQAGDFVDITGISIRLSVGIRVRCGRGIRIRSDILFCRGIAFRLLSTIGLSQLVLRRLAVLIGDRIHRHGGPGTATCQGQQQYHSQQ